MANYRNSYVSNVNLSGCYRSLLTAIEKAKWRVLRSESQRIVCREPNTRGDWEEDLVTIEIELEFKSSSETLIEISASSGRSGEPAYEYVRHQAEGILRRVDTALRPRKTRV